MVEVDLSVNTKESQTAELMTWSLLQAVHACKVNPYCDTVPFSFGKMSGLLALFKTCFCTQVYKEGIKTTEIYFDVQIPVKTQELQVYSFFLSRNHISD